MIAAAARSLRLATNCTRPMQTVQPCITACHGSFIARKRFSSDTAAGFTAYGYGETWLDTLGLESDEVITKPKALPVSDNEKVTSIACGWGHSALLHSSGQSVLVLGRPHDFRNTLKHINTRGGLVAIQKVMRKATKAIFGSDMKNSKTLHFKDSKVKFVRCGMGSLTAFGMEDGKLMCMGQNFFGQCGIGTSSVEIAYEPMGVNGFEEEERVTDVAVGIEHCVAVTDQGSIYTWGRGDRGQLGQGDKDSYMSAARVLGPSGAFLETKVSKVAANASSSACITAAGDVYLWGKMQNVVRKEERAGGFIMADQLYPRKVTFPDTDRTIVDVTMGQAHMACIDADSMLWMTGLRGRGLVHDDTLQAFNSLCEKHSSEELAGLLGRSTPEVEEWKEQSLAKLNEAQVPVAEVLNQVEPMAIDPGLLKHEQVVGLRSDLHRSYALTASGRLYSWNWKGVVLPVMPTLGMAVKDIQFGYNHTILLAGNA